MQPSSSESNRPKIAATRSAFLPSSGGRAANSSESRQPSSPAISANFSSLRSCSAALRASRAPSRSSSESSPSPSVSNSAICASRRSARAALRASLAAWRSSSSIAPSSLRSNCSSISGNSPFPNVRSRSALARPRPKARLARARYFSFMVIRKIYVLYSS